MSVVSELSEALKVVNATLQLRGYRTVITSDPSGQIKIEAVSTARCIYFVTVQMMRAAVAAGLWVGGLQFLAYEVDLKEYVYLCLSCVSALARLLARSLARSFCV